MLSPKELVLNEEQLYRDVLLTVLRYGDAADADDAIAAANEAAEGYRSRFGPSEPAACSASAALAAYESSLAALDIECRGRPPYTVSLDDGGEAEIAGYTQHDAGAELVWRTLSGDSYTRGGRPHGLDEAHIELGELPGLRDYFKVTTSRPAEQVESKVEITGGDPGFLSALGFDVESPPAPDEVETKRACDLKPGDAVQLTDGKTYCVLAEQAEDGVVSMTRECLRRGYVFELRESFPLRELTLTESMAALECALERGYGEASRALVLKAAKLMREEDAK